MSDACGNHELLSGYAGVVVTPAQTLLAAVPSENHLTSEAMIPNKDIGFVRECDPAKIKIKTFSCSKYSLLHGNVLSVSVHSIERDKPVSNALALSSFCCQTRIGD